MLKYLKIKEYLQGLLLHPESNVKMPTVRELMRQFNVSLATVNRALDDLENEGAIVRRPGSGIVASRQVGEVKGLRASVAVKESTMVLAYVDYPAEPIWNMTHIIERYLHQNKIRMIPCKIYLDTTMETVVEFVREQENCRGLLLWPGAVRLSFEDIAHLGKLGLPVAVIDSMHSYGEMPENLSVFMPDPESAGRQMAETLIRNGHRRIAYIRNEPVSEYNEGKARALAAALLESGVRLEASFASTIRPWDNSLDAAVAVTEENLAAIRQMGITAIVYTSSPGAMAAVRPLMRAGFRLPQDISLIAEGDVQFCRYLSPPLTVVSTDYLEMCCQAADAVLGVKRPAKATTCIVHRLIERESVVKISEPVQCLK